MLINKKLTVAAFLLMSQFTLHPANATNITVAVAANFATPVSEIVTNFIAYYSGSHTYTVTVVSGATGTLENNIISAGTGTTYDLFLAANTGAPVDLYDNYNSYVVGSPFTYARGYLELWSNNTSSNPVGNGVDVSSGLPSNFTSLVIANPTTAPYGFAATQVLSNIYGIDYTADPRIAQATDIGVTYADINTGVYPLGFVARSQICSAASGTDVFTGSHYSFTSGYDNILQDGIEINRAARSTDETTELTNFVNFLQNSAQGGVTILKYCYTMS